MTPQGFIDAWIRSFQYEMVRDLRDSMRRAKLENSGDLERSLYTRVNSQPDNGIFFMMVFFKEYGRFQDMKRDMSHAGGEDMVEALFQWAQKKGLDKFAKKQFADKYGNQSITRILNAIVWGTIRKMKMNPPKKRAWYTKQKGRTINRGYAQLIEGYNTRVLEAARDAIQSPPQ
jgi:hypothetical protein